MDGTEKRGRGKHDPAGVTKLIIIEFIYNHVSGVPTPDITGYLRKECNISIPRGIRSLLTSLEKKHYIKGIHGSGIESVWYPPDTVDHIQALLSDGKLWSASRLKKKPVEDVVIRLQEYGDTVVKLFNTRFFNDTVKPQIIQNLLSSPPFLEEFNTIFSSDLKSLRKSKADEMELSKLFNAALSQSPSVMLHMYSPSLLIRAGLYAIQINSKMYAQIAETVFQENPDQYPFVRDHLNEVREQLQFWKDTDHVPGDMFTSIEAFGLASVYVGMSIDQVQFPRTGKKIGLILRSPATNATLGKYLKNPFFSVEFMKFLMTVMGVWGAFTPKK